MIVPEPVITVILRKGRQREGTLISLTSLKRCSAKKIVKSRASFKSVNPNSLVIFETAESKRLPEAMADTQIAKSSAKGQDIHLFKYKSICFIKQQRYRCFYVMKDSPAL